MNATPGGSQLVSAILIYVIIAALLIFRYSRPQRMTVTRMFLGPIFLTVMTVFTIWATQRIAPVPAVTIVVSLVIGVAAGIPFGLLRGHHTTVRATDRPGVMYLGASWAVVAIWLGAFIVRAGLRYAFKDGPFASALGDALIAFAVATVIVSYVAIYRKYKALEVAAGQA